jgi:CheY-like chemotaxis protein
MLLKKLVEKFEIDCSLASNGKEAVEKVKNDYFDIVFMDMNMPGYSGIETAKIMKNMCKDKTPVIVGVSADDDYAEEDVIDHFVLKPFKIEIIKKLVEQVKHG